MSDAGPGITLPRVRFRDRVKALASGLWRIGERCGVHVLPVHFTRRRERRLRVLRACGGGAEPARRGAVYHHVVWFHWSETSLIRALLTDNPRLQIVAALSQLHHERPGALWLRVTRIPGTRLAQ